MRMTKSISYKWLSVCWFCISALWFYSAVRGHGDRVVSGALVLANLFLACVYFRNWRLQEYLKRNKRLDPPAFTRPTEP